MDELSQSLTPGKGRLLTEADVDVLLANDLNTLSFKERDFLYEEIHGVSEVIEETEELIQRSLAEMEQELRRIPEKPDYEEAMRRCPGYVEDRRFRLMFLRAKHFNTKEAAALLTRYLKGKRELFGDATLCRRVCYSDLDEDDKACLASGTYQWIPARDRAGRPIACDFMGLLPKGSYKRTENMLKSYAFLMMSLVEEDEESQRTGMCGIVYLVGSVGEIDPELNRRTPQMTDWLPVRPAAVHVCCNNILVKVFKSFILAAMVKTLRIRCRIHDGSPTEIQYELMSYGIPVGSCPVSQDGVVKTTNHSKWIARQKAKDKYLLDRFGSFEYPYFTLFQGIEMPSRFDVLLERGKGMQDAPGNSKMRQLCSEHLTEYRAASKAGKEHWHAKIVEQMQRHRSRFLRREANGWWTVAPLDEARKRAETVFRVARMTQTSAAAKEQPSVEPSEHSSNKRTRIADDNGTCSFLRGFAGIGRDELDKATTLPTF